MQDLIIFIMVGLLFARVAEYDDLPMFILVMQQFHDGFSLCYYIVSQLSYKYRIHTLNDFPKHVRGNLINSPGLSYSLCVVIHLVIIFLIRFSSMCSGHAPEKNRI